LTILAEAATAAVVLLAMPSAAVDVAFATVPPAFEAALFTVLAAVEAASDSSSPKSWLLPAMVSTMPELPA